MNIFLLCYGMLKIATTSQSMPGLDMTSYIFEVLVYSQPMSKIELRSFFGQLVIYPG